LKDQIKLWIENNKENILEMNRLLVSIPSQNRYPYGDEKEVQMKMNDILTLHGFQTDVFIPTDVDGLTEHPAFLGERHYDDRPIVVGVKKGTGDGNSVLFSGHMDTVPVGNDPWQYGPFSGEVAGDKQYGLGILDMKGGMAASILAVRAIEESGFEILGNVLIESVCDEEYGGANGTLACRLKGYRADVAIVPEPNGMDISPVNHGGSMFRIRFVGTPGRPFGGKKLHNPVYAGARFIEIFRQFEEYHGNKKSSNPLFSDSSPLPALIQVVRAGQTELPLSDRVPSSVELQAWIQCFPETTEEELYNDFMSFIQPLIDKDEILREMPPRIEKLIRHLPGTGMDAEHAAVKTIEKVSREVVQGGLRVRGAEFACDSFMFNLYSDTPVMIVGPKGMNAHSPDEYVEIEPFYQLVELFALFIVEWCGVRLRASI
jgi:acetylornithine deacetylase